MPRAYLRLDPGFDERKESYPDGPYAALIATFCLAELQPQRGRFRSRDYLARLLGKRGRHVAYLFAHGDLTELPDGRVYVDGWDEWQEGDWKVAERVSRIRSRKLTPGVTVPVTPDVTVGVTVDRLDSGAVHSEAVRSIPPTPRPAGGLRANGTSPRTLAEEAARAEREQHRIASRALHQRYLRGELTEAQYDQAVRDLRKEPDDLTVIAGGKS